jgi:rhamnogalacturonyl hydrolase YesR
MKSHPFIYLFVIGCCVASCNQAFPSEGATSETSTAPATAPNERLDELAARMVDYLPAIPLDSTRIPRTLEDGKMKGTKSKSWTSGFFPSLLWGLYAHSKDDRLKTAAENWQAFIEKEKYDGGTHDLGFKLYCSFGNAWKATGNKEYRDVFITASNTLITRYNEKIGALRSWDHHADVWQFPVIIDNMMNLEMLFEATRETGDSVYHKIAEQHALTTLKNHFRDDNSSYHVVSYDTLSGQVEMKNTHQGLNHESAWSRGQAWGLYGYGIAYKYTGRQEFLDRANKIADYIFTHPNLPADLIPYWDYDAPNIPDEPRDVSAAAITASGLFDLAKLDENRAEQYEKWANTILASLTKEAYQLDVAPFFLQHSVGSTPGESEVDVPIIYADYYYVEALNRSAAAATSK